MALKTPCFHLGRTHGCFAAGILELSEYSALRRAVPAPPRCPEATGTRGRPDCVFRRVAVPHERDWYDVLSIDDIHQARERCGQILGLEAMRDV